MGKDIFSRSSQKGREVAISAENVRRRSSSTRTRPSSSLVVGSHENRSSAGLVTLTRDVAFAMWTTYRFLILVPSLVPRHAASRMYLILGFKSLYVAVLWKTTCASQSQHRDDTCTLPHTKARIQITADRPEVEGKILLMPVEKFPTLL
jgi:hypothetical protein